MDVKTCISIKNQFPNIQLKRIIQLLCAFASLIFIFQASAIDLSDIPLDVELKPASTAVMFLLDDSGSMDYELLTTENDGGHKGDYYIYNFDNRFTDKQVTKHAWETQWAGFNKIYYNPSVTYTPWPDNKRDGRNLENADLQKPRSYPLDPSTTFSLSETYYTVHPKDAPCNSSTDWYETSLNQGSQPDGWHEIDKEIFIENGENWQFVIHRTSTSNFSITLAPAVKFLNTVSNKEKIIYPKDSENMTVDEYNEEGEGWKTASTMSNHVNNRYTNREGSKAIYSPSLPAGIYRVFVYENSSITHDPFAEFIITSRFSDPPDVRVIDIKNSHYFLVDDLNRNGVADTGENVFLVNIDGSNINNIKRTFYKLHGKDKIIDYHELELISLGDLPETIKPVFNAIKTEQNRADLRNFANWYSFYRRRSLTTKAAVAKTISGLKGVSVGLHSIHERTAMPVSPIKISNEDGSVGDSTLALLTKLYNGSDDFKTPLRRAFERVGKYFQTPAGTTGSPYAGFDNGGACQQSYVIVMTDGYWSNDDTFGHYGDLDNDGNVNCLSDIAKFYYDNDLQINLPDKVPSNTCDENQFQHLVTCTVSLGVHGTLNPDDYNSCTLANPAGEKPPWPFIDKDEDTPAKIDDLWHAAANTTGRFFSVSNHEELIQSLTNVFNGISARKINGASVAVSSEKVYESTHFFEGSYNSLHWTGELKAHEITSNPVTFGLSIKETPKWSASKELANTNPEDRNIITYNGTAGIPFRWQNLSKTQQSNLLGDIEKNNDIFTKSEIIIGNSIVEYIRGEEKDKFRDRGLIEDSTDINKLGDIVNASPVVANGLIYSGANDGMLHAFSATTGKERFAYIPNLVFNNLIELTKEPYSHRFYVDQTPIYARLYDNNNETYSRYIIGGLGKGGKGYYCLDVSNVSAWTTEEEFRNIVLWEYTEADMGFSFSKPAVIKSNAKDHPYVVIFGNGYNSTHGEGIFYILDLISGEELAKLHTNAFEDNGISSVSAIDVNNDLKADYAYAGDLKGNLWKLDITGGAVDEWTFAFGTQGSPEPLFTTAENQPITSSPDIARHCSQPGYLILFGTGKYLGLSDITSPHTQAIYCIWDYGDDSDNNEFAGRFENNFWRSASVSNHPETVTLHCAIDPEPIQWSTVKDYSDPNPNQTKKRNEMPNPTKNIGWYYPLPNTKERVFQDPFIRNGYSIVSSYIPEPSLCSGGGSAALYLIDSCSGYENPDKKPQYEPPGIVPVVLITPDNKEKLVFNSGIPPKELESEPSQSNIIFWQEATE